jgi:hypothetical protein
MTWQTWPRDEEWPGTPVKPAPTKQQSFDPAEYEAWKAKNGYAAKPPFDPSEPFTVVKDAERRGTLVKVAVIAITPPVSVLILGMSLLWVVQGFRSEPR